MIHSHDDRNVHGRSYATQIDGSWNVWLREPLGLPVQGAISIQLPPGRYTLFQRTSTEFELIPWHEPVLLGRRELEDLRGSGKLVIQGQWPWPGESGCSETPHRKQAMSPIIQIDGRQGREPREGDSSGFNLRREEAPLELELSAEDLLALSRPRAIRKPTPDSAQSPGSLRAKVQLSPQAQTAWAHPVTAARNLQLPAPRVALAVSVAVAAVLMGVVVYVASRPGRPIHEAMATVPRTAASVARPPSTPVSERLPVRLANPFDDTEVFEFPPGTSETEARETVADLLIKRARDREHQHERMAAVRRVRVTAR